jgi:hypothetical protein
LLSSYFQAAATMASSLKSGKYLKIANKKGEIWLIPV